MTRPAVLVALLASGCTRDPTFFGYWDVYEVERAGVVQRDVGFFEIDNSGLAWFFLRYQFSGGAWVPDPHPLVQTSATSAETQEVFGNYKSKGETYTLDLALFQATFDVDRYLTDEATLSTDAAAWPPGADLAPTTLYLRR